MGVGISGEEIFSDVFILDDLSPFGVSLPSELFNCFYDSKRFCVLDSSSLAKGLSCVVDNFERPVVLSGGGVLTYTLMRREGYCEDLELVDIKRDYVSRGDGKRSDIVFSFDGNYDGRNCIDDIVSSGATINQLGSGLRVASLVLSSQARGKYREKKGSTVRGVDEVFASCGVNCRSGFPAIFSSRYLVKKIRDDSSYAGYVSKYADTDRLLDVVRKIDKGPFDLLYNDPVKFVERYGK